jgi:tripartite-type tricarboxylate transporter receptor subunit TctC
MNVDTKGVAAIPSASVKLSVGLACAGALVLLSVASPHTAAVYPDRPLRLIVPFPPGGGNDILARAVGQRLAEALGQQIVIDNRGGAGGMMGAQIAATSAPDGYTLFLGSMGSLAHNPALRPNLPYSPPHDFAAVSLLATSPFILVVYPGLAARSVQALIALARAQPGTLNHGSAGAGSSLHMTGELFKHSAGVDIVHVAYKGTALALTDLMTGQVHMVFSTMPPPLPHVKSGKLRALGVTSLRRAQAVPDVPTIAESGIPRFEVENWQGIVVPARTPQPIIERLNRETINVLESPAMIQLLAAQGLDPAGTTPARFDQLIRSEIDKWRKLVHAAGIRVE